MAGKKSNTEAKFFDELKVWSEIKHRILTKYTVIYHRYRGGRNPDIYYVDGFAGAGRYRNDRGGNCRDGSPVILAKVAQEIASSGKPYRVHCINVEIDPGNYADLKLCLEEFDAAIVDTKLGSFSETLPDIVRTIGVCPAFFFLDPFGVQELKLTELTPLLRRSDTELLLNLNTRRLRMLAGFEDSLTARDRDAKLRLVSEVLGEAPGNPEPDWLKEWYRLNDPIAWEGWAARRYAALLTRLSPFLKFSVSYAVRDSYLANPKYYLVFATRAWEAVEAMNDLVCTEEDNLFETTEAVTMTGQFTMFATLRETEHNDALDYLLRRMHSYGLAHQGCCRKELIRHFMAEHFGQFKHKHYRQALDRLVAEGKARFAGQQKKDLNPITFV